MEFFRIKRTIPFMRHAKVFNIISLITFLLAVFFLFFKGLHFSIEFLGGTVMEVQYAQPAEPEKIRSTLTRIGLADVTVQNFGTSRDVLIRLPLKKAADGASQNAEMKKLSDQVIGALQAEDKSADLKR